VQKEKDDEDYKYAKNIRRTLKAYISRDGLVDLTEIWNGMCSTPRDFPQQK